MELEHAKALAYTLMELMAPYCERIAISRQHDDVFRLLGLAAIEPERRTGFASLRRLNG